MREFNEDGNIAWVGRFEIPFFFAVAEKKKRQNRVCCFVLFCVVLCCFVLFCVVLSDSFFFVDMNKPEVLFYF